MKVPGLLSPRVIFRTWLVFSKSLPAKPVEGGEAEVGGKLGERQCSDLVLSKATVSWNQICAVSKL
jgi:hypothetical protein